MKILHGRVVSVNAPLPQRGEDQRRYIEIEYILEELTTLDTHWKTKILDNDNTFQLGDSVSITIAKVM